MEETKADLPRSGSKTVKKFNDKVEKAWTNFEEVQKIKRQMKQLMPDYDIEKDKSPEAKLKQDKGKSKDGKDKLEKIRENIIKKYHKMVKQRPLDHAVLYLIQHPELMTEEPISTERLLLCCWKSRHFKSLAVTLDMLVEGGIVITLGELEVIVLEFIKKGIQHNENIHKYVQYLAFSNGFKISPKVWKDYLSEIFSFASKIFNNKLHESENLEDAINCAMGIFTDIYKNTCVNGDVELLTQDFKRILEITFASLENFTNNALSEDEKKQRRTSVVRPFLLTIINNSITLSGLFKNEFYTQFFVGELANWGFENPDFFQGLFTKLGKEGFSTAKIPWSVFKGIKDELHNSENKDLYFFVTKYFFDHYDTQEEVCNYVFSVDEYKELVKYFLSKKEELNDEPIEMNADNEAEFDGFLIL